MEFWGGNDYSSVALISPIIYSTFLQFQPMQLILLLQLLCSRNSASTYLKYWVYSQPYQPTYYNTWKPTFLMEFLAGNDCSSIASISPIIYSTFLQFQPMQLILLSQLLCSRNSASVCLKCWVGAQPHQTTLATTTTQQPTFLMEFRGGNDCSSVALISPVICVSFSPFQ